MALDKFGKDYLLLALRTGKLIEGFVDAYYGPPELSDLVDNEKLISPNTLLESCKNLQSQLDEQDFIEERMRFLKKTLRAIETSLNITSGKKIPFLEKVFKIYDIKPELFDDSEFYKLYTELDSIFKGSSALSDRLNDFREQHKLSINNLENIFKKASKKIREKTYELFPDLFPNEEEISIDFVKDKPWGAYNWYQGKFKSRIDINIDIPLDCVSVLRFLTHEAYPGHHTEHVVKEQKLYIEQKRFENSILLILAPEAVISEGIGNTAADVLFTDQEKGSFILNELCHEPSNLDLVLIISYYQSQGKMLKILNNIAIHAHEDGWSDDELIKYTLDFNLVPEKYIKQQLKLIRHPLWSSYVFNYAYGENLIKEKFGNHPSPQNFKKLLVNSILPSDLRN
ncbi:MAG: hypothetical protein ACFE8V_05485 [Promethearchaeota archaeon]